VPLAPKQKPTSGQWIFNGAMEKLDLSGTTTCFHPPPFIPPSNMCICDKAEIKPESGIPMVARDANGVDMKL
jgi:hypothetical protein